MSPTKFRSGGASITIITLLLIISYALISPSIWVHDGRIVTGDSIGPVHLGDSYEEVIAKLSQKWGPPKEDKGYCDGIGELTTLNWPGISFTFQDGRTNGFEIMDLTANAVAPSAQDLLQFGTRRGVMIGSKVRDVRSANGALFTLELTTLGYEWSIGESPSDDLRGFASGPYDDSLVTTLGTGFLCRVR